MASWQPGGGVSGSKDLRLLGRKSLSSLRRPVGIVGNRSGKNTFGTISFRQRFSTFSLRHERSSRMIMSTSLPHENTRNRAATCRWCVVSPAVVTSLRWICSTRSPESPTRSAMSTTNAQGARSGGSCRPMPKRKPGARFLLSAFVCHRPSTILNVTLISKRIIWNARSNTILH